MISEEIVEPRFCSIAQQAASFHICNKIFIYPILQKPGYVTGREGDESVAIKWCLNKIYLEKPVLNKHS